MLNRIFQSAGFICLTFGMAGCPSIPTPKPTPSPIVTPSPTPTPIIVPTPVTTPTPVTNNCPSTCPENAKSINARCLTFDPGTGKCRTDSTPRCGDIGSDNGYCGAVTGDPSIHSCKAQPEGSGLSDCDTQFLGSICMPWFYSVNNGGTWKRCLPDGLGATPEFSCDHFDDWNESMGEYTGPCEHSSGGLKAPITGYKMVPHGNGLVRACTTDQKTCSEPIRVNY